MATKEIAITKEVAPLVKQAQDIKITDEKSLTSAVSFLSKLNTTLKSVTKEKEKVTKPLNEALKAERGRWKPFEDDLEKSIETVRRAMTNYQTEKNRIAEEEKSRIADRVGEGKGKLKVETAVKQMEAVDTPVNSISTNAGSVRFKTVKKFEVMDITMLPHEYILANETAIREAMKDGKELPGVRYYTEEVPWNGR